MSISLHVGSIFDVRADAIVNAANGHLRHGGGIAALIERHAISGLPWTNCIPNDKLDVVKQWHADHEAAPLIATGNAYLTSAGRLPYKGVIHAVGPIWNGGQFLEGDLLELAMESAMDVALNAGFKSVVVPAISCGIFGFPVVHAARVLVNVANWFQEGHEDEMHITFAVMGDEHEAAFRKAIYEPLSGV